MRIQAVSDIHLETRNGETLEALVPPASADVVVLAGDIATGTHGVEAAARLSATRSVPVIYVLGNHEYHGWYHPELAGQCRETARALRARGMGEVHVLEREVLQLGRVRFLGATLWTDYRLGTAGDPAAIRENQRLAAETMVDHHFIHTEEGPFTPTQARDDHLVSREWLDHTLARRWDGPSVVVTHHPGIPALCHPGYPRNGLSAAFVSDLRALAHTRRPALWISGHTHANADFTAHGTRFVANQPGYPEESPAAIDGVAFDPAKVITL
ncbi:metallophosphoesterase [Arhodomonas sp. SL1]|uniref:metallophosphoesterase n=1 Tax=Arhodomonas sp. SL1 TaxID=3425691 RepID=UPI003F882041